MVDWLNLFDIELSQKRYWWGSRSQEVRAREEGGGERGRLYLTLLCHHQNDSCITMGSDESHFKVSLIVRDKVTRQCWFEFSVALRTQRPYGLFGHLDFHTVPEL